MDYIRIVEEFSEKYPDYRNDIANFNVYLKRQWENSLSDTNIWFLIQGLNVEFLLDSLIFNVEERKIYKRKNTAKKYATVIRLFFNYIHKNTDIDNPTFFSDISYNGLHDNTYMQKMIAYINNCDLLQGTIELEGIGRTEAEKVLRWSDNQLEDEKKWYSDINAKKVDESAFRKAMAALGMKMILIYGLTYRELRKIKVDQYDSMKNIIAINGFELRLPINTGIQMKRMKGFLDENSIKNSEGYFFINIQGEQWGTNTSTSGIPDYLVLITGSASVTGLVKYGILQLVKIGINETIIEKLTGAKKTLITGCVVSKDEEITQIINKKLVDIDLYHCF